MRAARACAVSSLVLIVAGCGGAPARFASTTPLWRDHDRQPFAPRPEPRFVPEVWDAADSLVFRPAARVVAFDTSGESVNVNALDEVPSSSWFENRIGRSPRSAEEIALGACAGRQEPQPPWRVVAGKVGGATAGFVFEDARGQRFLFKTDRPGQPEQATAADVIGAAVYHAVGYHVPCNRVVALTRDWLELDPDARIEPVDEDERAMTPADLDEVLAVAVPAPGGMLRGTVSEMVEGEPLGAWDYRGVWDADLNDVVEHQDRRELRGMRVLNAWVDHWDARQLNTLSTWVPRGRDGAGHVEHYVIDFGDTLGYVQGTPRQAARYGHSQWFDLQHITEDLFGFGLVRRPWDDARRGPTWPVLGHFDVERFDPDQWRPNYWNGAFERCTERDAAWMARILARFDEPALRALVGLGRFSDPAVDARLLEVLRGRLDRILQRYLTRLSPLSWPVVRGEQLCLEDVAVSSGLRRAGDREHRAVVLDDGGRPAAQLAVSAEDARLCVATPPPRTRYAIVRIHSRTPALEATHPIDVHLVYREGTRWVVAGLERHTEGAGEP